MSEIITAIKLIKFYAWEKYYLTKVEKRRDQEIELMRRGLFYKISIFVVVFLAPTLCSFVCLIAFFYVGDRDFKGKKITRAANLIIF